MLLRLPYSLHCNIFWVSGVALRQLPLNGGLSRFAFQLKDVNSNSPIPPCVLSTRTLIWMSQSSKRPLVQDVRQSAKVQTPAVTPAG